MNSLVLLVSLFLSTLAFASPRQHVDPLAFRCVGLAGNFPGWVLFNDADGLDYFQGIDDWQQAMESCDKEAARLSEQLSAHRICLCGSTPFGDTELYSLEKAASPEKQVIATFPGSFSDTPGQHANAEKCSKLLAQLQDNGSCQ